MTPKKPSLHQTLTAFKDKYVVNGKSKVSEHANKEDNTSAAGAFSEFINGGKTRSDGILSGEDQMLMSTKPFGFTHSA